MLVDGGVFLGFYFGGVESESGLTHKRKRNFGDLADATSLSTSSPQIYYLAD